MRKLLCCLITLALFVLLVCGVMILSGPYLDAWEAVEEVQRSVTAFREEYPQATTETAAPEATAPEAVTDPAPEPEILPELRQYMEEFNRSIATADQYDLFVKEGFETVLIDPTEYGLESDVVAVISIPALQVEHPLRIGANYNNLDAGFAIVPNTSMPIGGESTNCVIAGHRGWRRAPYLRNIEELELGDRIYIENPWEILEYEVCEVKVILPNEIESLEIRDGRDLITLYTCHPYLVSSHRYLVYAERVVDEPATAPTELQTTEATEPTKIQKPTVAPDMILSDGSAFESSEETIWTDVYGPWIFLLILFLLFLGSLIGTVRMLVKSRRRWRERQ